MPRGRPAGHKWFGRGRLGWLIIAALAVLGVFLPGQSRADTPLTNGLIALGNISAPKQTNTWTVEAKSGEQIVVRMGKVEAAATIQPWLRLFAPNGTLLDNRSGPAAEVTAAATATGTYRVVAADGSGSQNGTGAYRLTLAKTGDPVQVSPGDEGGPLTSGWNHTGVIDSGELDVWTIDANANDALVIHMGRADGSTLAPWVRLYAPNGTLLGTSAGNVGAIDARATVSGPHLVVVGDGTPGRNASGQYRLTVAKSGAPVTPAPGDEGGTLVNGRLDTGTIDGGDLDAWTITANKGDTLTVRMGKVDNGSLLVPWLRIFSPAGDRLDNRAGPAAEVSVRAPTAGIFLVVAADGSGNGNNTGGYRITLARSGESVAKSAGDEGGLITNGALNVGMIDAGDLDVWSVEAKAGENITVRAGRFDDTSPISPWVRLIGPDGTLLGTAAGVVSEVSTRATAAGTHIVLVGDGSASRNLAGKYRLTLAKSGDALSTTEGDNGGPLENGRSYQGMIDYGDLDAWTLEAKQGDNIVVRAGRLDAATPLVPYLRLVGPDGQVRDSRAGAAAELNYRADAAGTYLVLMADGSASGNQTGGYRISLAKSGADVAVAAGDEGGQMTNGLMHTGSIDIGDLDAWTFTGKAGDFIVLRMGKSDDGSALVSWVRLFGPDGTPLGSAAGAVAEVAARATVGGKFLVIASDGSPGRNGTGAYRLTLAKSGDPVAVSPDDQGGPLSNGLMHQGAIPNGDLDVWSFEGKAGENCAIRMGRADAAATIVPSLRLLSPEGVQLDFRAGPASEVAVRLPVAGTYVVVAGDGSSNGNLVGAYRLTLAKTGDTVAVAPGDEGGSLSSGLTYNGVIDSGDLDVWTVEANAGDKLIARMGQADPLGGVVPWLRLFAPDGTLLDTRAGAAAEVGARAAVAGRYLVVAGDGSPSRNLPGGYRLTLARSGTPAAVSDGDTGGLLGGGLTHDGALFSGDLDVYSFTACVDEPIELKLEDIDASPAFVPYLRLYGRDGTELVGFSNGNSVQSKIKAPATGIYTLVVADGSSNGNAAAAYRLTVNGLTFSFRLCLPKIPTPGLVLGATGGEPGRTFHLLSATDVTTPINDWTPILTNQFGAYGEFATTNKSLLGLPERYFLIRVP